MKTIKQWFEECADRKLGKKMLRYARESGRRNIYKEVDSLAWALDQGFNWRNTPEGAEYWMNIFDEFSDNPEKYRSHYYNQKEKLEI